MPEGNPLSSAKAAREQSAAKLGFMSSMSIDLGGGTIVEIPNPSIMSPEQQSRYDALEFECEKLDRWPDPKDADGNPKLDANGQPLLGARKMPHRVNGELVENYETRLARALLGDQYEKFIAAGGYPSQIGLHWGEMRKALEEREKSDSKSVGSDPVVDSVPEADRSGT